MGCSFGSAGMDATSIVVRGKARKIPRTNALQQLYRSMHTDLIPSSKRCCGPHLVPQRLEDMVDVVSAQQVTRADEQQHEIGV